jgi:hypothetical protein
MKTIYIITFIIFCALTYVVLNKDKLKNIVEDTYSNEQGDWSSPKNKCQVEGRLVPSGHLPGSWIILTDAERKELLKTFVENGQEII